MTQLYKTAMTPEVFGWTAASNNQLLVAGRASYILNSISAYRTAQKDQPETGADIFFRTPLVGPAGEEGALAHGHAVFISMIPNHAQYPDTAKEFLFHLVGNYAAACEQSELYNFPAWPSTVPDLESWLDNDPYGSEPADKLVAAEDRERLDDQPRSPGPGQRGDRRDLRPADPAEHDGPCRHDPADARRVGRRGRSGDQRHLREVAGRGAYGWGDVDGETARRSRRQVRRELVCAATEDGFHGSGLANGWMPLGRNLWRRGSLTRRLRLPTSDSTRRLAVLPSHRLV